MEIILLSQRNIANKKHWVASSLEFSVVIGRCPFNPSALMEHVAVYFTGFHHTFPRVMSAIIKLKWLSELHSFFHIG